MFIMECKILNSEKDMVPNKKLSKTRKKSCEEKKFKFSIVDDELKENIPLIENSVDQVYDIFGLSNLVSHSSQLCLAEYPNDLAELEISNDDITALPQMLSLLKNLKKLIICKCLLETLPNAIGELQNLCILNLSHNKLKELPDNVSGLKNLESLDLSFNKLENLPLSYAKLQRLRELNISNNNFTSIPKCIENGMGTLRVLNISQNYNVRVNIIPNSKYLEKFYARENKTCCKFPDWILTPKFFNLKEFDLDETRFDYYRYVGKEGDLCLRTFSMACSNLSSPLLEMMIENMINLEKINVGNKDFCSTGNVFNRIPIQVLKNPGLIRELNFRGTSLPAVPAEINQLCNLQKLDVGLNCITWLPDEFCELQKLEYLIIDGNGLIMLPKNIGNLKSLKEIKAENNSILRLPQSFENLKNLKIVDIYNNIFEEFPNVLCEMNNLQGLDLEQNFFTTDDLKIKGVLYSTLRDTYRSEVLRNPKEGFNSRSLGVRKQDSIKSDDSGPSDYANHCSSEEEGDSGNKDSEKSRENSVEENWDALTDSDDEFDPESLKEISYNGCSKQYIPLAPNGFCPADLHSRRIKAEVASMRVYGSLPSFKVEQGQFDDA